MRDTFHGNGLVTGAFRQARRRWLCAAAWALALLCAVPAPAPAQARNPLVWADVPDLSVLRVGDTYYMSSTTMHLSPGLPIMRSKDLANWEIVGYAYDILDTTDDLSLKSGKSAYGRGSWASSLRLHDGTFYATTFSANTGKTHVYTTKDIEHGPWKAAAFRPSLHDHSLFFEGDGRVFMTTGSGNIRLVELTPDVSGIKSGGVDQVIIKNAGAIAGSNGGLPAEGSQIYKVNGRYYIFLITWPRGGMRTELVYRSDHLAGPYEGRVALKDRGIAQGGIFDTPDGRWFAMLFRDSGAVGRIPYLVPVKWEDGWPVFGTDGKAPDVLDLPAPASDIPGIVASDEFDRAAGARPLPLVWQWNHNPVNEDWSLSERPGFLRIRTGRVSKGLLDTPNTLTQRSFGPECSGAVALDVSQMTDGDVAGLAALQKNYGFVGVKRSGGANAIVMVNAGGGTPKEVASVPLSQPTVHLKIGTDFRERADQARFYYSLDGKQWQAIGDVLKMRYTIPHFMGYRFALFHYATGMAGGVVDFDYFRIGDKADAQNPG